MAVLDIIKQWFASQLLDWYTHNHRIFPWRYTSNPYKVLVSEVLLQQTNADRVVETFEAIVDKYPVISNLADADNDFLRGLFNQLGLFYRADRLIDVADQIINRWGEIPKDRNELISVRGVGDYTCNAVLCFGYGLPYPIVDTNVIRVYKRFFGFFSDKSRPRTDKKIWEFAESILPKNNITDFNYALLDFAATVCTAYRPDCINCVLKEQCSEITGCKMIKDDDKKLLLKKKSTEVAYLRSSNKAMKKLIDSVGDLELHLSQDYYSRIVKIILGQQLSTKAAESIYNRLIERFNGCIDAQNILEIDEAELRALGVSKSKTAYIKDFSHLVNTNEVDLKNLDTLPDEEVIKQLCSIKGIGLWSAQMFLIFSLGRIDVWAYEDAGLKRAVKGVMLLDETPSPKEMIQIGDIWRPYRTAASLYLWRALDNNLIN